MKPIILALLCGILLGGNLLATMQEDGPLHPGAVAACQSMNDSAASYCQCPTAYEGRLCQTDEPLPNFCKVMCKDAKKCSCCPQFK